MAGRTIIPRYIGFFATGTATGTATAGAVNATGPLYPAMEPEGFDCNIEEIASKIEDGQTTFDAMTVNIEGYIRGTGLLANTTLLNLASTTGTRVSCRVYVLGAPGTLSYYVENIQMNMRYDTKGQKERVFFKGTKTFVRDINSTGADVGFFTQP